MNVQNYYRVSRLNLVLLILFFMSSASAQNASFSVGDYAAMCAQEIGPLPPFSCIHGKTQFPGENLNSVLKNIADKVEASRILPVSINGRKVGDGAGEIPVSEISAVSKCDRPKVLGGGEGQCQPFSRIGRLPSVAADGSVDPDVEWTYICRRYNLKHNGTLISAADPLFEDVAIIGTRKTTGATCFFQMLDSVGRSTDRVPSPMESEEETPAGYPKAKEFWLPAKSASGVADVAGIQCYECHNRDPWIHTPYVDQVCEKDTATNSCLTMAGNPKPLVPFGADRRQSPTLALYRYVAAIEMGWPTRWRTLDIDENADGVPEVGERCAQCHTVGVNDQNSRFNYCSTVLENALGRDTDFSDKYLTSMGKKLFNTKWMPPNETAGLPPHEVGEANWQQAHQALFPNDYLDKVISCCRNPNQNFCSLTEQ